MPAERRRLHPAAIGVYGLSALGEAALPLVALFAVAVLGRGLDEQALVRGAMAAFLAGAFAVIAGVWRWHTTSYGVTGDAIHHRYGILSIKETDVPLARIQSLDLEQGPLQRLFGVHAVHVQTGGGGKGGEIVLQAVGAAEVRALQELVGRPPGPEAVATGPERRLGRPMLLVAALTAGQLGVILPVLAGLAQFADDVFGPESMRIELHGLRELALALAALLVAAWALSVLGAIVAFAGFTVSRDGDRLRIRRGLLQRRQATVAVERVRAAEVVEGVLRRPFGLAALRIEVIGHAKEAAAAQTLFPLLRRGEVRPFLERTLPELAGALGHLERPPRRALRRYTLPPAAAGLAAGALVWALAPVGPWPLLAALPGAGYGALRFRAAGWRLAGEHLAMRRLALARTTVLARAADRESHAVVQNVLQRRGDLADVEVAFGKSTTASVRHIEAATARRLFQRLSAA
jgi:putative membrane protein